VAAPHGVRGLLKVKPLSADPASLLGFPQWWLRARDAGDWAPHRVRTVRLQAGLLVAQLDGIGTRDAAGALRGAEVGVPRESLPALAEHEHYQSELVGSTGVNRSGEVLGTVVDFIDSGAHPIMRVARADGLERLIPWVAQYVDHVAREARRIEVDWPADY
jgi:16S rRNA processing protein RimM